jgi:hypothetical protein
MSIIPKLRSSEEGAKVTRDSGSCTRKPRRLTSVSGSHPFESSLVWRQRASQFRD